MRGSVANWQIACMAEGNHSTNPSIDAPSNDGIQVRDSSGDPKAPLFRVRSTGRGLGVERRLMIRGRREFTAYAAFQDEASFFRWWDGDAIALKHPRLHQRLRRVAEYAFHRGPVSPKD